MKAVKFEVIKRNAMTEFVDKNRIVCGPSDGLFLALLEATRYSTPQDPNKVLDNWIEIGSSLIREWDIRRVKKLIELFPTSVPKFCREATAITVDYDEAGDWVVIFG